MATSLVSTGVQFPDSTIQTTAATGGPNWATAGTTLVFVSGATTSGYTAQGTARGLIFASNNPTTTDFVLTASVPPEQQLSIITGSNDGSGQQSSYPATYPQGGMGVGATTDYAVYPYFVYDGFTGRYTMTVVTQMAGYSNVWTGLGYTTDFVNWRPYLNYSAGGSTTYYPSAFNHYTGTRVYTTFGSGSYSYSIFRVTAANAYDFTASPTTSVYIDGTFGLSNYTCRQVRFVDTGSSGTSYFLATASNNSGNVRVFKSTDDGVTWTEYQASSNNNPSRIVGNNTELMFYMYNQGIRRSTNGGVTWGQYDYGSNTQSTSSTYYPTQTAWNGSFWITIYDGRANYKAMGSGTSWTTLTNFPSGISSTEWTSVAWNQTLGCWLLISRRGTLCSNSNSDPTTGTWTFRRAVTPGDASLQQKLYVVGQTQYNF